jgi:hypothetical protein
VDENNLSSYNILYDVSDSSGNDALTVTRQVTVVDNISPEIKLLGDAEINLQVGDFYTDAGATATDNYDGNLGSVTATGSVNTSVVGTYILGYNITDSNGNSAQLVIRTVVVGSPPSITLQGENPMTIEVGGTYNELGATAYDIEDEDLTDDVTIRALPNTI